MKIEKKYKKMEIQNVQLNNWPNYIREVILALLTNKTVHMLVVKMFCADDLFNSNYY